jgi:hypothetical protein
MKLVTYLVEMYSLKESFLIWKWEVLPSLTESSVTAFGNAAPFSAVK